MSGTVLVSTHRLGVAGALKQAFEKRGYQVDLAPEPSRLELATDPVLAVVTGEGDGGDLSAWAEVARDRVGIPVFAVLPGPDGVERGSRAGAEESFPADPDPDEVVLLGHRTIQRRKLQGITGIVGESEAILEVLERIVQIAPVDSTVLITGESGTGKELVARGIHALSSRRHRSFLAVNVAAVSETLLESELFGHEKGAFTGAIDSRKGFFELAHKGTLFLDEIGEMPPSTQTKLLRVLEQREFLRVGGEKATQVDVRIIAATNQELRHLVRGGRFRRDLYYRLNILGIELPPLRHRREDVPRLVAHFVRELRGRIDRPFPGITRETMDLLMRYDWPGNVRELRNLVESMVVLAPGREIEPRDLPREIRVPGESGRLLPATTFHRAEPDEDEAPRAPAGHHALRPELEFLFRTMVELKMDVDQLRGEFERYRERLQDPRSGRADTSYVLLPRGPEGVEVGTLAPEDTGPEPDRGGASPVASRRDDLVEDPGHDGQDGGGVTFRPGMTMEELEREAIRAVLREMDGNRRKAAESLGIGERTLYRKIRKFGIEE